MEANSISSATRLSRFFRDPWLCVPRFPGVYPFGKVTSLILLKNTYSTVYSTKIDTSMEDSRLIFLYKSILQNKPLHCLSYLALFMSHLAFSFG